MGPCIAAIISLFFLSRICLVFFLSRYGLVHLLCFPQSFQRIRLSVTFEVVECRVVCQVGVGTLLARARLAVIFETISAWDEDVGSWEYAAWINVKIMYD
jgi:hypothetical protein